MADAKFKISTLLADSVTLTAGASTATSETFDFGGVPGGGTLIARFTNLATGPTVPAQIQMQQSVDDGTTWIDLGSPIIAGTGNNEVSPFTVRIPDGTMLFRIRYGSNTAQNVTLYAAIVALKL